MKAAKARTRIERLRTFEGRKGQGMCLRYFINGKRIEKCNHDH